MFVTDFSITVAKASKHHNTVGFAAKRLVCVCRPHARLTDAAIHPRHPNLQFCLPMTVRDIFVVDQRLQGSKLGTESGALHAKALQHLSNTTHNAQHIYRVISQIIHCAYVPQSGKKRKPLKRMNEMSQK